MHQLLSLFILTIFAQENILFNPIYPLDIKVSGERVNVQWEILEEGYQYKLEILKGANCHSVKISFPYTQESSRSVVLSTDGEYCWRLKYRRVDTEEFQTSDSYPFSYIQNPLEEEIEEPVQDDDPINDEEEDIPKEEQNIVEIIPTPSPTPQSNRNIPTESKPRLPVIQQIPVIPEQQITEDILGIETESNNLKKKDNLNCSLTYDRRKKRYIKTDCNFEFPNITKVEKHEIDEDFDYIVIQGDLTKTVELQVVILDCKRFSLLDPFTWFRCKEKKEIKDFSIPLLYSPSAKIEGKKSIISTYDIEKNTFFLKIFSEKLNNEEISLTFDIYFYVNIHGHWLDVRDSVEKTLSYSLGTVISGKKPLRYVFSKIVGVTQWHGNTKYASPHTGIDFGSVREKVLSPADGTICAIGWDSYYGKCNSGGKYLKIKHVNGMYTVYMHLESYINEKGGTWKVGNTIRKGQQIGISGNTGAYNCQPLGYHLHYELRQGPRQSSHTNPVPYTNINWNLIPTINWKTYPGRLSGDNPHPNF